MNLQIFSDFFGNGKVLFVAFLVRELDFSNVFNWLGLICAFQGECPALVPVVDTVVSMGDVVKAHTIMESSKNTGKIVMTVQ